MTNSQSKTGSDSVKKPLIFQICKGSKSNRKIDNEGSKIVKPAEEADVGPSKKRKKCIRLSDDEEDVVHKKKKFCVQSDLKIWNFYVHPRDRYLTGISVHTNCLIVDQLKSNLNDQQLQMFNETCFGYFLDLQSVFIQNQLIHALFLRKVVSDRDDEI
ncbi:hypothetical protein RND71_001946 [Anisodus tanguticus]|uniref:Uncharacterized protein n=1 Tax=Anisodus tanguticus TaxID=243964 RepID=A0AAE1T078_9SOLA|nr:hypothetical protein RND71_001946 [Anisodus tanguticus]